LRTCNAHDHRRHPRQEGRGGRLAPRPARGGRHVRATEPDTVGFFISQDLEDPCVFTTYERFTDRAAMDRHNGSAGVAKFFGIAKPLLDGAVTLITSSEISAKG
jgi:quinol monooxygenase YgiN